MTNYRVQTELFVPDHHRQRRETLSETKSKKATKKKSRDFIYRSPTKITARFFICGQEFKNNYRNRNNNSWLEGVRKITATETAIILYTWCLVGRKTRVGTLKEDNCVSGEIIANFFGWWFSEVNGIKTFGSERLDVEPLKKYPCLAACASLWRQPSLFGDGTHAVGTRPKWAREHGLHIHCGSLCRWVASLAHRQVLGTRTWADVNVRPRPLEKVDRHPKVY